MAAKKAVEVQVAIPAPNIRQMGVRIKGTSPLIFHKWSEKAKRQIRDKQAMKAKTAREVRNPVEEYINSFYYTSGGEVAFPALSIKQALVGAARSIEGVTMTELRGAVFVIGDPDGMIPVLIEGKPIKPQAQPDIEGNFPENIFGVDPKIPQIEMREDMVRVGMGSADLRYRGQVKDWEMAFIIKFNANKLSYEQVLNLVQYAGFSSGLGEWRPEKNGGYGTFEVSDTSEEALQK